jgi:hypothetical protein
MMDDVGDYNVALITASRRKRIAMKEASYCYMDRLSYCQEKKMGP